jgi:prepilin-type N-terminal cleavage/methylation domain-containing protein
MKNFKQRSGFTLIELLVVIAIIAILAVVVVLTLNPAELLRQARDSNRVSDLATIKSAESLFEADVSTSSVNALGTPGWAFSATTTTGLTTTSTGGWAFASADVTSGVSSTASRVVTGQGWIPTNLSAISSGAPIGSWPVDPVNNASFTYVFVASGTVFKIDSMMESAKYKTGGPADVETGDGGNSIYVYEQGSNLAL